MFEALSTLLGKRSRGRSVNQLTWPMTVYADSLKVTETVFAEAEAVALLEVAVRETRLEGAAVLITAALVVEVYPAGLLAAEVFEV